MEVMDDNVATNASSKVALRTSFTVPISLGECIHPRLKVLEQNFKDFQIEIRIGKEREREIEKIRKGRPYRS